MAVEVMDGDRASSPNVGELHGELLHSYLALMDALEASLERSRKALLALDVCGVELETGEQMRLVRKFDAVLRQARGGCVTGELSTKNRTLELAFAKDPNDELRRRHSCLLSSLRLQAALLKRVQCKLRVMANCLAGPSALYGPPRCFAREVTERADPCRA
jgi:hypothetical protein